jgi:hypothetical protein
MSLAARITNFPVNSVNRRLRDLEDEISGLTLTTPQAPTITPVMGVGTTQTYKVVAVLGNLFTAASAAGSTAVGPTTLTTSAYNIISWMPVLYATSYWIFRTVGGPNTGRIATIPVTAVDSTTKPLLSYTFNDTGIAGDGTTAPSFDTTAMPDPGVVVEPVQVAAADGAIIGAGLVLVTKGSAAALTLTQPVAGLPSAGGQDGMRLSVVDTTGYHHTVTTAASGIVGGYHIATSGGAAGSGGNKTLALRAYNGTWYVEKLDGWTIS